MNIKIPMLLLGLMLIYPTFVTGQESETFLYHPLQKLPIDENVKVGKLDNGMTYYIRHNEVPAQKVELRLVFNAGSILETDEEQGLSHFLEHMSFTGTSSFPGTELVNKLEGIGVHLGRELNAATFFEETVYYLPIPVEHLDLGLHILQEWAMNLALTEKAIDRERGVIIEELRLGKGASTRIREQYLPILFKGSDYPKRLPIGKEEVIANFPYDVLRNFYKKWHRPDLTAIIVVGDIDPETIEKSIKEKFAAYAMPSKVEKRTHHYVPDHKDLRVAVATDKETSGCSVEISYKHKPQQIVTQKDYLKNICHSLYSSMVDARLSEATEQGTVPFSEAEIGYSNYFRDVDTYSCYARCAPDKVTATLTALADENERIRRYGFSATELDRAKKKLLAKYYRWYEERDKTASDLYADECQVNYLTGNPMPGINFEYHFLLSTLPTVSVNMINELATKYMTKKNRTIVITGPQDRSYYPTDDELRAILEEAPLRDIKPYDEGEIVNELMNFTPEAGTIVSEKYFSDTNITEWTLSNGVKVVIKPTDFKNNQILFRATSDGGYSMFDADDDMSALYATRIQDESGVNGINNIQLRRLMVGKDISITQSLVLYNESMSGKFGSQDMEEFFQLVYLYHTAPYFDKAAFERVMQKERAEYAHLLDSPDQFFGYEIDKIMSNGNSRRLLWPTPDRLDKANFEKAVEIYKNRFGNAAGFTYVFVGNVDLEALKPFVLTYLGGLPTNASTKRSFVEQHFVTPTGPKEYVFHKGKDNKVNVNLRFSKKVPWNKDTEFCYNAFIDILNSRLYESMRIEMSGVYGVRVSGSLKKLHEDYAKLNLAFGTNTEAYEKLCDRAILEINKLISDGPTQEEVERVKQKKRVALESDLKLNGIWLLNIFHAYRNQDKVDSESTQREQVESLTPGNIQQAGAKCIDTSTVMKFVLLPEKQ
ncbi:M16 family metallopeptidase [Bacteroides faecalis]|nr:insulinase family protein [Bacteroides faecalis]